MENLTSSDFELKPRQPKVLVFDIETTPLLIWSFDTYNANALKVEQDWYLLCWSAKWVGGKQHSKAIWDYDGYKPGSTDDRAVVSDLWNLLNEADVVVGHNARKFDVRKTQAKGIEYRLPPLPPYKIVDTWEQSKRLGKFTSHRLGSLGETLGIGAKLPTDKDLWFESMSGNVNAQKRMVRYCKQDVLLTEKLYLELRPYMPSHPSMAVLTDIPNACRNCGGTSLKKEGFSLTLTGKRQRYSCLQCGTWMSGKYVKVSEIR